MRQVLVEVEGWAAEFERLVERINPTHGSPARRSAAGSLGSSAGC